MQVYLPIAELSMNLFFLVGIGGAVGFLSGLFGVGGGFLLTPLLIPLTSCCPPTACAAPARRVLGWLLAHPDTSYTHAQMQATLGSDAEAALDRVTLYRLIDRLTQVGLLLCRGAHRLRRSQAMPSSVHALPHFECQTCHRDSPLPGRSRAFLPVHSRPAPRTWNARRTIAHALVDRRCAGRCRRRLMPPVVETPEILPVAHEAMRSARTGRFEK